LKGITEKQVLDAVNEKLTSDKVKKTWQRKSGERIFKSEINW
jgi:hypothetical protein